MRRHFEAQPTHMAMHLSAEEEAVAIDENNEIAASVQDDTGAISRILDMDSSTSDVQTVVATMDNVGEKEAQLIETVADMATAGTDVESTDIIPSVEPGVSTEDFISNVADKAKKIWEAIKTAILKMLEGIKKLFRNLWAWFSGTEKKIEKAKEINDKADDVIKKAEEDQAKPKEEKDGDAKNAKPVEVKKKYEASNKITEITMHSANRLVMPNGSVPENPVRELDKLHDFAEKTYLAIGRDVEYALSDYKLFVNTIMRKTKNNLVPKDEVDKALQRFQRHVEFVKSHVGKGGDLISGFKIILKNDVGTSQGSGDNRSFIRDFANLANVSIDTEMNEEKGEGEIKLPLFDPVLQVLLSISNRRWGEKLKAGISKLQATIEEDIKEATNLTDKLINSVGRFSEVEKHRNELSDKDNYYVDCDVQTAFSYYLTFIRGVFSAMNINIIMDASSVGDVMITWNLKSANARMANADSIAASIRGIAATYGSTK